MQVLPLIDLPTPIPLGCFTGQFGNRAVIEELNNTWQNSGGSGVLFGQDAFGDRFRAFSSIITAQADEIKNTVLRTVEATTCPNKFQFITCPDDLYNVPICMYVPLLTDPRIRPYFEAGKLDGWGLTPQDLPTEDVAGRLIKNGSFDTSDPNYSREAPVEWTFQTGDPNYTLEELEAIETSRDFICSFLEEQLGDEGENIDFTNYPNRMGKLKGIK